MLRRRPVRLPRKLLPVLFLDTTISAGGIARRLGVAAATLSLSSKPYSLGGPGGGAFIEVIEETTDMAIDLRLPALLALPLEASRAETVSAGSMAGRRTGDAAVADVGVETFSAMDSRRTRPRRPLRVSERVMPRRRPAVPKVGVRGEAAGSPSIRAEVVKDRAGAAMTGTDTGVVVETALEGAVGEGGGGIVVSREVRTGARLRPKLTVFVATVAAAAVTAILRARNDAIMPPAVMLMMLPDELLRLCCFAGLTVLLGAVESIEPPLDVEGRVSERATDEDEEEALRPL